MEPTFVTDAEITTRIDLHRGDCGCALHTSDPQRRLFTRLLVGAGAAAAAGPLLAREGVEVGGISKFAKFYPADQLEADAVRNYAQVRKEAASKSALLPADHPQMQRLNAIAQRLIPYTYEWNARAKQWKWEVSLIGAKTINAFCMPGGKIAFFLGILQQLQLNDNEVAMIMGHEMAHALREHARERIGKTLATRGGISIVTSLLGVGELGRTLADAGGQLMTLKFGRDDESEADLVGMELAARAGYDPRAGVTLWKKMGQASKGAPQEFFSTHPSSSTRIQDIESNLKKVDGLYARAEKPPRRFAPPPLSAG
ncbi:MAG TPA: M48 family metallopeptidase [Burkholderiaceae bacterium]|jgi:Zn-dependent protease with chaperone function|nr:M48 family metallopeptidase [Burkholderiaceae bacterium]